MEQLTLINEYTLGDKHTQQLNLFDEHNKREVQKLVKDIPIPLNIIYYKGGRFSLQIKNLAGNFKSIIYYVEIDRLKEIINLIDSVCRCNIEELLKPLVLRDIIDYYEFKLPKVLKSAIEYIKSKEGIAYQVFTLDVCNLFIVHDIKNLDNRVSFGYRIKVASKYDTTTILNKVASVMLLNIARQGRSILNIDKTIEEWYNNSIIRMYSKR